jgi:hypothetical protein
LWQGFGFRRSRLNVLLKLIEEDALSSDIATALELGDGPWSNNWLWSLPIILLTVLVHSFGLVWIERVIRWLKAALGAKPSRTAFAAVVTVAVLLITGLHALEGAAWAFAYVELGASPDRRTAMLYSISAMTSFGHAGIYLDPHWQMMGALEALNGMMLFGLTTAFLFSMLLTHWPSHASEGGFPASSAPVSS